MDNPGTPSGGPRGKFQCPSPYSADEHIHFHVPKNNTRRLGIMSVDEFFTTRTGYEKQEMAFVGLLKRPKHWGRRHAPTAKLHAPFMNIPFARSYEEIECQGSLASVIMQLRADAVDTGGVILELFCGRSDLRE